MLEFIENEYLARVSNFALYDIVRYEYIATRHCKHTAFVPPQLSYKSYNHIGDCALRQLLPEVAVTVTAVLNMYSYLSPPCRLYRSVHSHTLLQVFC